MFEKNSETCGYRVEKSYKEKSTGNGFNGAIFQAYFDIRIIFILQANMTLLLWVSAQNQYHAFEVHGISKENVANSFVHCVTQLI